MDSWVEFLDPQAPTGRFLRWKEVERLAGISRTTAWRLQKTGRFPRPYVISSGRVGYLEREIEAWKASCVHRSSQTGAPSPLSPARLPGNAGDAGANSTSQVERP